MSSVILLSPVPSLPEEDFAAFVILSRGEICFYILLNAYRVNSAYRQIVFEKYSCHCETSAHTGRGNPPVERNQVTIPTQIAVTPPFFVTFRYISPLTGGLPRQCAHWLAMTASIRQTPICRFAELTQ